MKNKAKKLTTVSMLCALAYVASAVGRIPLVLFLKYDPKDIIIVFGGLILGPLTSFLVAFIVSLAEMVTISENGMIGCFMNILSSCSFACTAAFIYSKSRKLSGVIGGLFCGWGCQVIVMLLWNYLITPFYMGYPREAVVELLIPAFLPFNLIKGGLNASITMLLYKPVVTALRHSHLIKNTHVTEKSRLNIGIILASLLIIVACISVILSLKGIF